MCLNPVKILNPAYSVSKKNPLNDRKPIDERLRYIDVPCGHCPECRYKKKMSWQIRLQEHNKYMSEIGYKGYFVTLTFSEQSLAKLAHYSHSTDALIICTTAIRLFRDRFRKSAISDLSDLHYFLIPELGHQNTERLHLHGLIWLNNQLPEIYSDRYVKPRTVGSTLSQIWLYGNIYFGHNVSNKAINYITKYMLKKDNDHPDFNPNPYHSRYLGDNFLREHSNYKFAGKYTITQYRLDNGKLTSLPSYYMHKLYTPQEREFLQVQLLDTEYKFIHGIKVHSSQITNELINILTQEAKNKFQYLDYSHNNVNYPASLSVKQLLDNNETRQAYYRLVQPLYSKKSQLQKIVRDNDLLTYYPKLANFYISEICDINYLINYIKSVKTQLHLHINNIYYELDKLKSKYKDNFKLYYYVTEQKSKNRAK